MERLLKLIVKIDLSINRVIEVIAQRIQVITGFNSIWQARLIMIVSVIFAIVNIMTGSINIISGSINIFMGIYVYNAFDSHETKIVRENMSGLSNSFKNDHLRSILKLICLILSLSTIFFSIILSRWRYLPDYLFFVLAIYLLCCDTLPPAQGKLKEWLKSLFFRPETAEVKA